MSEVKRIWKESLNPHCEIVTMESGQQIAKFWADKTFRNIFERMAYSN